MKIGTYNFGDGPDREKAGDLLQLAAEHIAVLGTTESTDRHDVLSVVDGHTDLQVAKGAEAHTALLVAAAVKILDHGWVKLNDRTKVGRLVAGARHDGYTAAKWVEWVRVDVDGTEWTVGVAHFVPSVGNPLNRAARRLFRQQAQRSADWFATALKHSPNVVLVGDFNATSGSKLLAALRTVAQAHSKPSRGRRAIDIVWTNKAADVTGLAALDGYSSDHRPVVADVAVVDVPKPKPAPKPKLAHKPQEAPVSVTKLIHIAEAEVGYHEGRSGGHWNNDEKYAADVPGLAWANHQPWCDTFVNWCYHQAEFLDLVPVVSAGCDISAAGWKKAGRWSEYPAIGAQVFYGTPSDLVHTGLVIDYDDDTITTIEGNTNDSGAAEGDGVYRKVRRRRDPFVVGYGYPKFPEGIKSADPRPKFKREAPKRRPNRPKAPKPAPQPAPEKRPYHEQQALDEARTVADNAAKAGHKPRASKWRAIVAAILGKR